MDTIAGSYIRIIVSLGLYCEIANVSEENYLAE